MRLTWQQVRTPPHTHTHAHTHARTGLKTRCFPVCQVVMLAMYNLSLEGTGRQGYFRWKEDICSFIGRHWNFLLGNR